jgi:phosphoribosylglycinamide formyltransferase-1
MKKIALFISGRGSNMKAIVEQCQSGILSRIAEPVLVFSDHNDAAGLKYASEQGIATASLESKGMKRADYDRLVLEILAPYSPDYIVLAGYMRILSPVLVNAFPKRIINIHPADTTQHQGLHGYEWAWENKLVETKVTVHYVDEGIDTGTIIAQAEVDVLPDDTVETLHARIQEAEHVLYPEVIDIFARERPF